MKLWYHQLPILVGGPLHGDPVPAHIMTTSRFIEVIDPKPDENVAGISYHNSHGYRFEAVFMGDTGSAGIKIGAWLHGLSFDERGGTAMISEAWLEYVSSAIMDMRRLPDAGDGHIIDGSRE